MDQQITRLKKRLAKKAKRGFRGYPVGTLSCYGPDDRRASKLVAAIVEHEGGEAAKLRKWYSKNGDVRDTLEILEESVAFFDRFGVLSVVMLDKIIEAEAFGDAVGARTGSCCWATLATRCRPTSPRVQLRQSRMLWCCRAA